MPNKSCPLTKFFSLTTTDSLRQLDIGNFMAFFLMLSAATDIILRAHCPAHFIIALIFFVGAGFLFKSDIFSRQTFIVNPAMGAAFTISIFGSLADAMIVPSVVPNLVLALLFLVFTSLVKSLLLASLISFIRDQARKIAHITAPVPEPLLNDRGMFVIDGKECGFLYSQFLYLVTAFKGFSPMVQRALKRDA